MLNLSRSLSALFCHGVCSNDSKSGSPKQCSSAEYNIAQRPSCIFMASKLKPPLSPCGKTSRHSQAYMTYVDRLLGNMQGINNFCREIGITRTGGELPLHILDFHVRGDLHLTSPRTLAVLHPLRVVITNLPEDHYEMVDAKASLQGTRPANS